MAWWGSFDSGQLTKIVSSSLKNAQKKIDKVLDIQDQNALDVDHSTINKQRTPLSTSRTSSPLTLPDPPGEQSNSDSFVQTYLTNDSDIDTTKPHKHTSLSLGAKKVKVKTKSSTGLLGAHKLTRPTPDTPKEDNMEQCVPMKDNLYPTGDWITGESMTASMMNFTTGATAVEEEVIPAVCVNDELTVVEVSTHAQTEESSQHPLPLEIVIESASPSELNRTDSNLSLSDDASSGTLLAMSSHSTMPAMGRSGVFFDNASSLSNSVTSSMLDSTSTACATDPMQSSADFPSQVVYDPAAVQPTADSSIASLSQHQNPLDEESPAEVSHDETRLASDEHSLVSQSQTIALEVETGQLGPNSVNWSISPTSDGSSVEVEKPNAAEELPASCNSLPDTGTSSDIEVISSCCASSVNGETIPFISLSNPSTALFTHKRSASGSNLQSPNHIRGLREMDLDSQNSTSEMLLKKLIECRQLLEIRESKLLEQNRENLELREELLQLKQSMEEVGNETNMERLTQEFTDRLRNAENRFQIASRERDQLKKEVQKLTIELASKDEEQKVFSSLQEKELQITELLKEGEKLAQEQMKKNVTIKTLRAKEKEMESQLNTQNERVVKLSAEIENLKKQIGVKDENEKKHTEAINQLTKSVQWQDKEIHRLKGELESTTDKCRGYQNALEISSKDTLNLHRQVQELQTEIDSMKSQLVNDENGRDKLERKEMEWQKERSQLVNDLTDLRTAVSRKERENSRTEETLRSEIRYYQERLSIAEERNEELSQSLTSTTKPILRQLEALQSNYASQNTNWEKLESSLNSRIVDCQQKLAISSQNERAWREKVVETEAQISGLEQLVANLKGENQQLSKELATERAKGHSLHMDMESSARRANEVKRNLERQLAEARKNIVLMESALDAEKMKVEAEKNKYAQLKVECALLSTDGSTYHAHDENSPAVMEYAGSETSGPTTTMLRRNTSTWSSMSQDDPHKDSMTNQFMCTPTPLYDTIKAQGTAALMEHLQSLLKQKNGEIAQLHREIQQLERSREQLVEEVSHLHSLVENNSSENGRLQQQLEMLRDTEIRYQTLLQLHGEKLEENEELRLDLQDVKEMYRIQIEMLLKDK